MKFGEVPIGEAEGAILAHSHPLPKGRLRKGHVLEAKDIAALEDIGRTSVVVAQLEAGDIEENEAARRIAAALVPEGSGLHVTRSATGRVNVLAAGAGVAEINVAAIHALNAINPMVTVATVAPYARMIERGMVATVKIIAYGVREADVDAACYAARGALMLHRPKYQTARFIQTSLQDEETDKGFEATKTRLAALGVSLVRDAIVPHEIADLSAAITQARGDFILILTASATSDIRDTVPASLIAAGGEVDVFGMPVDPGNLLFFGTLDGKPVIGLPGCARSPALNGADWVMERLLCGVAVTQQDISHMGVGGLLKEIATRPHPRDLKI
ncbi:molybdopterin-binding protein [Falsihalocynthiibacter sp. S25ZX9]|uniref:molybdopterin-binding protein n=1 Tax=Falsihalocynthiibacter sp. S25ZX9 TaxID=3240870 RepID=UPI00350FFFEE